LISDNGLNFNLLVAVRNEGLLTMARSTVRDNRGNGFGGGLDNRSGTATLIDCTFSGNTAGTVGGGIANDINANLTMINSTLSGNTAGFPGDEGPVDVRTTTERAIDSSGQTKVNVLGGGGLFNAGWATLVNCTITGNTAVVGRLARTSSGGGVLNLGSVTLSHTIIAGNTAPIDDDPESPRPIRHDVSSEKSFQPPEVIFISQGYNLIGITDASTGWIGTDLTGTSAMPRDPLLAPLAGNGGPTLPDGSPMLTHMPRVGSPAIDAGDPAFDANAYDPPLDFDQRGRGFMRMIGNAIDIGAFELQTPELAGDYNRNGTVDAADYVVWRKTLGTTDLVHYRIPHQNICKR
jgi:hypothetical protein